MIFMVTAGAHVVTDPNGPEVTPGMPKKEIQYVVGETFESDIDLAKRHPEKFRRVYSKKNSEEFPETITLTDKTKVDEPEEPQDNLDNLSMKELRDYAVQLKLPMNDAKTKEAALAKIRAFIKENESE